MTPRVPRRRDRSPYDQLAKGLATDALSEVGKVQAEVELVAAVQRMDLWHEPDPARAAARWRLGLLGEVTVEPCQIEPFARTPGLHEVRSCVRKQLHWHHDRERRAKHRLPLPRLCITSPGRPTTALRQLGFQAIRPGVYQAAPGLGIYVLVLSEVIKNRDTLLLRMLGSGRILAEAVAELMALPDDAWEKELALPWLLRLGFKLPGLVEGKEAIVTEVREWFERYKQGLVRKGISRGLREGRQRGLREGRQRGLQEGRQRGLQEGRREALEQLCALRLGRTLSSTERSALFERLERVGEQRLGEMLLGASAETLAAWLADPAAG